MSDFQYHRAADLDDAAARIAADGDAQLLAGGMTLIPAIKLGLNAPTELVDLGRLGGLSRVKAGKAGVQIGALATHAAVAASPELRKAIPALADLAGGIGDPQVRNRGTLGGSIANNDPAADYPAACVGLGAVIETDRRQVPADDFFTGLFSTVLEAGEIITAVNFPVPEKAAYMKFPNPASRYALVGVFVALTGEGARVAVTGASAAGVFRQAAMEAALSDDFSADAIAGITLGTDGLNADIHAGAEYRAHLVGVMARRAVAAAG